MQQREALTARYCTRCYAPTRNAAEAIDSLGRCERLLYGSRKPCGGIFRSAVLKDLAECDTCDATGIADGRNCPECRGAGYMPGVVEKPSRQLSN